MKPTKELLISLYENLSFKELASHFGIHKSTLWYYFKKFDIKRKPEIRIAPNLSYLCGQKFGKLLVLERVGTQSKTRQTLWKCLCDCGNEKIAQAALLTKGNIISCGCENHRSGKRNERFKGYEDISRGYWYEISKRAKEYNREFSITIEYTWELFIKQNRKCALSGIELTLTTNYRFKKSLQTASLDRIDSSKGYIEGNVQWVHKKINTMKMDMSDEEFVSWCKLVAYLEKN